MDMRARNGMRVNDYVQSIRETGRANPKLGKARENEKNVPRCYWVMCPDRTRAWGKDVVRRTGAAERRENSKTPSKAGCYVCIPYKTTTMVMPQREYTGIEKKRKSHACNRARRNRRTGKQTNRQGMEGGKPESRTTGSGTRHLR